MKLNKYISYFETQYIKVFENDWIWLPILSFWFKKLREMINNFFLLKINLHFIFFCHTKYQILSKIKLEVKVRIDLRSDRNRLVTTILMVFVILMFWVIYSIWCVLLLRMFNFLSNKISFPAGDYVCNTIFNIVGSDLQRTWYVAFVLKLKSTYVTMQWKHNISLQSVSCTMPWD